MIQLSVRKMNHQPLPIQQQQQQQQQLHHQQQQQQHKQQYIVHPAHLYNQKSAEIIPQDIPSSYLHHHPGNSQAIYVNTITAYHNSPQQQQQQQQQHQQQQLPPRSTASNVIYVNASSVVPANVAGQHNHFPAGSQSQPQQPRHPGSGGHVPYRCDNHEQIYDCKTY